MRSKCPIHACLAEVRLTHDFWHFFASLPQLPHVLDRFQGLEEACDRNGFRARAPSCVPRPRVWHYPHLSLASSLPFIGADPNATWLNRRVAVDNKGFVVTGAKSTGGARGNHRPVLPLETSRRGVFAIGEVRAGSTKRVAAAVGEGAAVVAQIHSVLAMGSG